MKPGDRIRINSRHFVCAGQEFTIAEIHADGQKITTTDSLVFWLGFFEVIS